MPILVIAAVVIVAIGAGAYFFTNESVTTLPENNTEVVRPETEAETATVVAEPDPEPEADADPVVESSTETEVEAELLIETEPAVMSEAVDPEPTSPVATNDFVDGSYTASVSYLTPSRSSLSMDITVTIADDTVTASSIVYDNGSGPSNSHQRRFDDTYKASVVGMELDEISLSRVAGASLTTDSFNEAVVAIEAQARS